MKKGLCRKIKRYSVQVRLETKQNEKTRSSTQISGVMVSHRNTVWCQPPDEAPYTPTASTKRGLRYTHTF